MSVRLIIIVKGNFLPFYNLLEIASVKNARKAILKSSTWKYEVIDLTYPYEKIFTLTLKILHISILIKMCCVSNLFINTVIHMFGGVSLNIAPKFRSRLCYDGGKMKESFDSFNG